MPPQGAAAGPGHPSPREQPHCGCEGPGYSILAEISCSGCAVLDTASPWKPSRSGCAGSGDAISTETRLRRLCRPGCAGRAPGCPRWEGWGCPGRPWLRDDGEEPDPPSRPKGAQGSRGWSAGHPCPQHGAGGTGKLGGVRLCLKYQHKICLPCPILSALCQAEPPASVRLGGGLTPSPTLGLSQAHSGEGHFLCHRGWRRSGTRTSPDPSERGCRTPLTAGEGAP